MTGNNGVAYARLSSATLFLFSVVLVLASGKGHSELFIGLCVVLMIIQIINQAYIVRMIRHERSLVQADIFFMLAYFGVLGWAWAADVSGIKALGRLPDADYEKHINEALALVALGLSAFVIGFNSWSAVRVSNCNAGVRTNWRWVGYALFYTGAALILGYALYFGKEAFFGRYAGSEVGNLAVRSSYLLQGMFLKLGIVLIYLTERDHSRWIPKSKVTTTVVLSIMLMYLILGDRSEFASTAVVALFAYAYSFKRVTLPIILIGILGFVFISSVVQVARIEDDRSIETIIETATSSKKGVSVESGLENVSSSGFLILTALTAVPDNFDFFLGKLKINELLGILPFGRKLLHVDLAENELGTSSWLTWRLLGPNASWGVGTNIVADIYLDFGVPGVAAGLMLLGLTTGYLQKKVNREGSCVALFAYCFFAGILTIMPRYAILTTIRGLVWPLIFLWLIQKLVIKKTPVDRGY